MPTNQPRAPIAIVGIGCRFPGGAHSPSTFWNMLQRGDDAIVDVPTDRWDQRRFYHPDPDVPGKLYTRQAGFLQQPVDEMDTHFFGISPREAAALDPQQRLLLEVTWEAFEDAGIVADDLRGSATGVYIGGFTLDNKMQQLGVLNRDAIMAHTPASSTMVMLSNRLSYTFDLRGPSLTVDTACSSSLTALHLACQSLWQDECTLAVCGGVNMMLRPEYMIAMCKGRFLSPDSRSLAFDERANGYARGEGAGVVLLKPLTVAQRDGDPIYAVVCATGVNQDGRTDGITLPNETAQHQLACAVLHEAGISADQVAYVEAHGTGTQAGDPVEARSLGAVFGAGRTAENACWIGSVKTNIGHLEAAAGVAGLIKLALCLKHRSIPPHLHLTRLNPQIDLEQLGLRIPRQNEPWTADPQQQYAAINSFGYGGANAHAILRAAPPAPAAIQPDPQHEPLLLPLSARSPAALSALAAAYSQQLADTPAVNWRDVCATAALRRSQHPHRLALVSHSLNEAQHALAAFARGEVAPVTSGTATQPRPLVFVYTGMGAQWWGMARELWQHEPVFRASLEACDAIFRRYAGWSLLDLFTENRERYGEAMDEPAGAQPANFALQIALTALWRSYGVQPDAVVGHSVGEIAAACVAGVLALEDALRLTYHRSQLQQARVGQGAMLAVGAPLETLQPLLADYAETVSVAALNSPTALTLAGDPVALRELAERLERQQIFQRFLKVAVAYHSYQLDSLQPDFLATLDDLRPAAPAIPLYSTVTGQRVLDEPLDASYWWQNTRQPVQLAVALESLITDGYSDFLEVGPHPVLASSIHETLREHKHSGQTYRSLYRQEPERAALRATLGALFAQGYPLNWRGLYPTGQHVSLPTYPWQRERVWHETDASRQDRAPALDHPLLHTRQSGPRPEWETQVNAQFLPYINDHRIQELVVFPGAAYVEAGLALAQQDDPAEAVALADIRFHATLMIDREALLRLTWDAPSGHFAVYGRGLSAPDAWELHASGRRVQSPVRPRAEQLDLADILGRCHTQQTGPQIYAALEQRDLHYGPAFQALQQVWHGEREVLAEIAAHPSIEHDAADYWLHPTLLDSAFQSLIAVLTQHPDTSDQPYIPVSIQQLCLYQRPGRYLWSCGRITQASAQAVEGDLWLCDEQGQVCVEVRGVRCQSLNTADSESESRLHSWLHELRWEPLELPTPIADEALLGQWLIFADQSAAADDLIAMLAEGELPYTLVQKGTQFVQLDSSLFEIAPDNPQQMQQLIATVTAQTALAGVIYMWDTAADEPSADEAEPDAPQFGGCISVMHLVQALVQQSVTSLHRLCLVTCGAQPVQPTDRLIAPEQTALLGLGRVIASEHPALGCVLADLDADNYTAGLPDLLSYLLSDSAESEIALRAAGLYAQRLVHAAHQDEQSAQQMLALESTPAALVATQPGSLDSLTFVQTERRAPQAGEIEIQVHSSALNFKDLLKVLNLLPADYLDTTFYGAALGLEGAGTVVAVGPGVAQFRVGDAVVCPAAQGAFRSFMTVPTGYVVPKPQRFSFAESCTFINFITAYYGLHDIARLQPGERVLIHAATGGVGLAAVQVARWLGAEIYATAGSPHKRDYLRSLGVEYVSDSRSLAFVDDIRNWTANEGVDVVFNSLSGELLTRSLELLRPFGRFVEIGKRDIHEHAGLALTAFDRNLSFSALDIDRMMAEHPVLFRRLLDEVWQHMQSGTLKPLPTTTFAASEAADAFRAMAQAQHIGKLTLQLHEQSAPVMEQLLQEPDIRADATYLITGGLGGFGLTIARWLVAQGARHLVLVGRRGAATPDAAQAVESLEAQGAQVMVARADIANQPQVSDLLGQIQRELPPLRGVVHAAMVLDDAPLLGLDQARFARVLAPKALGAWYVHQSTRHLALDFFVLCSSVSALTGNVGQASYAAANAFLDGLAHYRRARGLPATSINWGVLGQVGVVARNAELAQHLARLGIIALEPQQATAALAHLLRRNPVQMGVIDIDWSAWGQASNGTGRLPRYQHVLQVTAAQTDAAGAATFRVRLRAADPAARQELAETFLSEQVRRVLRLSQHQIEPQMTLKQLGVDSLMAVELTALIEDGSGVKLPSVLLMQGPALAQLATRLVIESAPVTDASSVGVNDVAKENTVAA